MSFEQYTDYVNSLLKSKNPDAPYDNPDYFKYAKLNWSRMNRWLKNVNIYEPLAEAIKGISSPTKWVLITEPWCGDASHSVPIVVKLSQLNPLVTLEIQLRDLDSEIENYRTRGGKSIPKLIMRNQEGVDLAIWGPRPEECQVIYDKCVADQMGFDDLILTLQKWYNKDKGSTIQKELLTLMTLQ